MGADWGSNGENALTGRKCPHNVWFICLGHHIHLSRKFSFCNFAEIFSIAAVQCYKFLTWWFALSKKAGGNKAKGFSSSQKGQTNHLNIIKEHLVILLLWLKKNAVHLKLQWFYNNLGEKNTFALVYVNQSVRLTLKSVCFLIIVSTLKGIYEFDYCML